MTRTGMRVLAVLALAAGAPAAPALAQRVTEIQIAPPLLRLRPGAQVQVLATAYDRDGVPVEARIVWTSTNINVATVDSLGMVHAVAPGLAIITASTDSTITRRRHGRSTVFVSTTGSWVSGGPGKTMVPGDTIPPPECDDLEFALRNPGRMCWDVRPTQRGSTFLAAPASCTERVRPVVFQLRVGPDGRVRERRTLSDSGCEAYLQAAAAILEDVCCNPAYRNGRPVTAWTIFTVRPPYQPRVLVTPPAPPTVVVPAPPAPPRRPATPAPGKQGPRPSER
jgi:hypothetical protein